MTEEQNKLIYKDVIKEFGFVKDPSSVDASYLLRGGQFLDTKGDFSNHQHINIANYISQAYDIDDLNPSNDGSFFMQNEANAVKITCWDHGKGIKGIYLPKVELSGEQYDALEDFVNSIAGSVTKEWPLWVATYDESQQIEYTKPTNLAERVIADIENYYYSHKLELTEKVHLTEDTRNQLISKSKQSDSYKNPARGNRWTRKNKSSLSNSTADYNKIDMDTLFKNGSLTFGLKVQGETSEYVVTVSIPEVWNDIQTQVKANLNKLDAGIVYKALLKALNGEEVKISCTCLDFKYRIAYWATQHGTSSSAPENRKSDKTNPEDTKGAGCKHINLVLSNLSWLSKIASVIVNYINYCKDEMQYIYSKYIFPKVYGIAYDKAVQMSIFDYNEKGEVNDTLSSDEGLLNLSNALGKVRGRYKKGSNKNPTTGTGGREKKKEPPKEEENTEKEPVK